MDVELNIASDPDHQALYDMYKNIDDRCIKECIGNIGKWFSKSVDESFIEEEYKSPVTSGWGNEPASLRVEIVSERPEDLVDMHGRPISPSDVTALSSVVIQMQLLGIWASEKYLGCHWRALAIKADLDHDAIGRRRASSPRPMTPPVIVRGSGSSRRAQQPAREQQQPAREQQQPTREQQQPTREQQQPTVVKEPIREQQGTPSKAAVSKTAAVPANSSKDRVQEMLQRFREQKAQMATSSKQSKFEEYEVDEKDLPSDDSDIEHDPRDHHRDHRDHRNRSDDEYSDEVDSRSSRSGYPEKSSGSSRSGGSHSGYPEKSSSSYRSSRDDNSRYYERDSRRYH
jgi:hypothetical protein